VERDEERLNVSLLVSELLLVVDTESDRVNEGVMDKLRVGNSVGEVVSRSVVVPLIECDDDTECELVTLGVVDGVTLGVTLSVGVGISDSLCVS
jgi:hypothetical protein